jgi:hypothetical protein
MKDNGEFHLRERRTAGRQQLSRTEFPASHASDALYRGTTAYIPSRPGGPLAKRQPSPEGLGWNPIMIRAPEARHPSCLLSCRSFSLLRHRNRHCFAGAAFGDPDRVARRLDCGWCLKSFLDYRNTGLIAIDRNNRNLAAAVLSNE